MNERVKEHNCDAVLVVRLRETRKETKEVVTGAIYSPPPDTIALALLAHRLPDIYVASSYLKENTFARNSIFTTLAMKS